MLVPAAACQTQRKTLSGAGPVLEFEIFTELVIFIKLVKRLRNLLCRLTLIGLTGRARVGVLN